MFYTLDYSADTKIIGPEYPQVQKMKTGYDLDGPNSIYKLSKYYKSLPDFIPDLDGFVLHSKAKLTDFLSNALTSRGYIISEKTKNILQNYKLPLHAFYPIQVYKNKLSLENYYWFHIIYDFTDFVDYQASTFFIYKSFMYDLGDISIASKEDLLLKRKDLEARNPKQNITIWAKHIKLHQKIECDFFKIGTFDNSIYITEQLKNNFEEKQINGIVLSQAHLE